MRRLPGLVIVLLAMAAASDAQRPTESRRKTTSPLLRASLETIPLHIVENRGVFPDPVRYYVTGKNMNVFFTPGGITFSLRGDSGSWTVKTDFVKADSGVVVRGAKRRLGVFSYFRGPREAWKTGLPSFGEIVYENLWPGIDLVYRAGVEALKYEFVVRPGADPGRIRLRVQGATSVTRTVDGSLRVDTPVAAFEDAPPTAYQNVAGGRSDVPVSYVVDTGDRDEGSEFAFLVDKHDATRTLVIDPAILVYCGFLGGAGSDMGTSMAVDGTGSVYITGYTDSNESTFPVVVGPDLTANRLSDAFVAKVDASGTALLYCGYIGGSSGAGGSGIDVDAAGCAYVAGGTSSNEQSFPVAVGPDLSWNGLCDAFVAKVNPTGTGLLYCGYIGGSGNDGALAIAVDRTGNAYVVGTTTSNEQTFPVAVGPDLTYNGTYCDGFIARVNASGSALVYCGYIGGVGWGTDTNSVAVDSAGHAYVTGSTDSDERSFPVNVGPDLTYNGGQRDAYVAKVNASGSGYIYCGYLGGASEESGHGIALDESGNAFVTGYTGSDEQSFPVTVGPDLKYNGGWDTFVAKVNAKGTVLVYCGYIGGSGPEAGVGIAVDRMGNAYLTGNTESTCQTFPVTVGPDLTFNGSVDAYVAKVNASGTALVYCGYIGGPWGDYGRAVAVDASGNLYVTGDTNNDEKTFPVTKGPDLTYNGNGWEWDGFVAKISATVLGGPPVANPGGVVQLDLTASDSVGLAYQVGSSLGMGPIPVGARQIDLSPDDLLFVSVRGLWPWIFVSYRGIIDSTGQARASVHVPNVPALVGLRIHSAFVTLDVIAPSGIRSISNTCSFTITR